MWRESWDESCSSWIWSKIILILLERKELIYVIFHQTNIQIVVPIKDLQYALKNDAKVIQGVEPRKVDLTTSILKDDVPINNIFYAIKNAKKTIQGVVP